MTGIFNSYLTKALRRALVLPLFFVFTVLNVVPSTSYAQAILDLPAPGAMVATSSAFVPTLLRAVKIDPAQPFVFDFIVDSGNAKGSAQELKAETEKIAKYFLASLAIPGKDLWVNLSPFEKDRITTPEFGQTQMGRDLLAQDYILKQLTASLIHPEKDLGKAFWDRVYSKAQDTLGTTDVPVDSFNKVWIVPTNAVVYEINNTAIVGESHLKVMMQEDYVAMSHQKDMAESLAPAKDVALEKSRETTQLFRDLVLPEIEKEVNSGKNFALLRQVYNALILASWYKENLKESLLSQVYADQKKVNGVDVSDKNASEEIYQRYLSAYKTGVFNFIKEETDPTTGDVAPRKYFSGGVDATNFKVDTKKILSASDLPDASQSAVGDLTQVTVALANEKNRSVDAAQTLEEIKVVFIDRAIVEQKSQEAEQLVLAGKMKEAFKVYSDLLKDIQNVREKGKQSLASDYFDEVYLALRSKILAVMANILENTDLNKVISQSKFALYSGPPAGGKGDIWIEFTKRYAKIADSFKLFHTRGIRKNESQANPWHFRTEEHLMNLEKEHKILTTLVNNQLQGLPLETILEDKWVLGQDSGVAKVEGLDSVFGGSKVRVLEGGFGWFLTLNDNKDYQKIATIFISPFNDDQIEKFESEGAKYKAMFEKSQELYRQELVDGRLMSQDEFVSQIEAVGALVKDDLFVIKKIIVNGFKMGGDQQDWPGFKIKAATSKDIGKPDLRIEVDGDGLFYAAAYETAKRLHGRQWKAVRDNNGDFKGKTPKDLGFADAQNYLDRSYEAAVQVHTRNLYGVTLINGYQDTSTPEGEAKLRAQMGRLTDDFAYTIFLPLIEQVIADVHSSEFQQEFLKSVQEGRSVYGMIKPEAVGRKDAILQAYRDGGFEVVEGPAMTLNPEQAAEFYAVHKEKKFFQELVDYTSGEGQVIPLFLTLKDGNDAVEKARGLVEEVIRPNFGTDIMRNATHGSDKVENAVTETALVFGWLNANPPKDMAQAKDKNLGGIDLDPAMLNMKVERTGERVKVTVDPAMIERIKTEGVDGLRPVIINIVPVKAMLPALGLGDASSVSEVVSAAS